MLTQDYLKSIFSYDPEIGIFRWEIKPARNVEIGDIAGSKNKHGYILIKIKKKHYYAHRLAWLYVHGIFPENKIDHIDRDKANNKIQNLREVTAQQNAFNRNSNKNSTSKYIGVHWCSRNKRYVSKITCNGKIKCLGYFINETDAYSAYLIAKKQLHII